MTPVASLLYLGQIERDETKEESEMKNPTRQTETEKFYVKVGYSQKVAEVLAECAEAKHEVFAHNSKTPSQHHRIFA